MGEESHEAKKGKVALFGSFRETMPVGLLRVTGLVLIYHSVLVESWRLEVFTGQLWST